MAVHMHNHGPKCVWGITHFFLEKHASGYRQTMKKEIQQNLGFNANMVQKHSIAVIQLTSPVNDID